MVIWADVLVSNFKHGTMEALGLGYDVLNAANPRVIVASSSGFGPRGRWSSLGAFDMATQARSTLLSSTTLPFIL